MENNRLKDFLREIKGRQYGDIMVVGGGISGIQASLDLATQGYKVYLVEKLPAIGGKMAQLDKTFPTNDCSMCIESPKFIECARHPNIEILTYTQVEQVEGEAGNFKVTLLKKPRYVDETKCTGCTTCVEYCPVLVPDPFNQELSQNKAIHIYFSQAVPLVSYIDDDCLYLSEKKCGICSQVCGNNAIDFSQQPQKIDIRVGAIILAPGYSIYDPSKKQDYGYGRFKNVVTSLDFERLLCSTGPFEGEIRRPSDLKHPKKVAWIHCVGSRNINVGAKSYCSAVCCSYIQKQVILAKDHDAHMECWVFHNDIRSYGKDFERFYQRASALPNVHFIRSYVSAVKEDPNTRNITIRYAGEEGVREEEFDLVVLGVGIMPPEDHVRLAEKLGIELNYHGFSAGGTFNPIRTTRPGIFVSGAFQGPMDIPESVVSGIGAGAQASELLNKRRGKLKRQRVYPKERDVRKEEPRVGVFVCHCGANIGRVVNVPSVVDYALRLPHVVHAQEQLFSCSTDSAQQIVKAIKEKDLNRVIVAACTPRTHEPLFRDTLREAGLNPYLFEMANIREHCSWVHSREKEDASSKAKDIVRRALSKSLMLEPLEEYELPVDKHAVVVGGGVSGMTCALSLANQGFEVFLVERESQLGGNASKLHYTLEGDDVQSFLRNLIKDVMSHPLVHVYTEAEVVEAKGYVGNFTTKIKSKDGLQEIHHGCTVIATGAKEYTPKEYYYGLNENVVTQVELENLIASNSQKLNSIESVVMIQCIGCREPDRNYCARICCSHAIKNAIKIKELKPNADVFILFRDMRTYSFREDYYRLASDKETKFIRYDEKNRPIVEEISENGKKKLFVTVYDPILQTNLGLEADLLVLSAAVVPREDSEVLSKLFKVPLSPDGFFQEAHVKLRPVDFAAEGVYLCGLAHYPKHLQEAINQAYGAAGRAATLLSQDKIIASGAVCEVDKDRCVACGACITACTYGAIDFVETEKGKKARVNPILCKGDGLCNAKCPTSAIVLKHFTDNQIYSEIESILLGRVPQDMEVS